MFSAHPDWELRIVYASTENTDQAIAVITRELVVENLDRIPKVLDEAGPIPALLMGWSIFEAAARLLVPEYLGRPQPSGRLLELLASDGYITPEEADFLRSLARLRNEAAHGHLDAAVTRDHVAMLVSITRTLLVLSDATAHSH